MLCVLTKQKIDTSIQSSVIKWKDYNAEDNAIDELIADCAHQKARQHPL